MTDKNKKTIGAVASLLAAVLYVVLPTDVVPDVLPAVGWLDDVAAVLLAVANALRILRKK